MLVGGAQTDIAPLDALIITAADGEDEAVRLTGDPERWQRIDGPPGYSFEVWSATFPGETAGRSLRIAVSRAFAMGTDSAAHAAAALTQYFRPRCLAMCGVCAGRPHWTKLGDLIIADRVYLDVGELANVTHGGVPRFRADLLTFPLRASWKQAAQRSTIPPNAPWLSERPLPFTIRTAWVL